MRSIRIPVMIALFGLSSFMSGQPFILEGTISDSLSGETLVGCNVVLPGNRGTATDLNGYYRMELEPGNYPVEFRFTGYRAKVILVQAVSGGRKTLNVQLVPRQELLDQVVVSAGKYETKLSEVTVSMDILKPDYLEQTNTVSLDEVLDKMSGVNIIDGQANIRGGSGYSYGAGSRVMLLVDGLPMLSGDAGFPSWSFVPVENVGQVEVIKGAASVLYGSAALNGVVNLRTAYPTSEPETRISFFSGLYNKPQNNITNEVDHIEYTIQKGDTTSIDTVFRQKAWWKNRVPYYSGFSVLHKQKLGNLDLVAGTYAYSSESFRQGEYSRRIRFSLGTRWHFPEAEGLTAGVNTSVQTGSSATFFMWNGTGSQTYIPLNNTMTDNHGYKLTVDPFLSWAGKSGFSQKLKGRLYRNYNLTDRNQSTISNLWYGEYQASKSWDGPAITLTGGLAASYTSVVAELYSKDSITGSNQALYAQAEKRFFDRLKLMAGARYEFNRVDTSRESKPVFRVGLNYKAGEATFLRASYGQGYRFPTIAEMFVETSVGFLNIYPNPNLHSETGWNAELGIKQGLKISEWKGFADLALFWTEYQDMMEFLFGGESGTLMGFQSVNIGNTMIRGVEITLAGQGNLGPVPLEFSGGYTYLDPRFKDFDSIAQLNSSADYNVLKYRFRHTLKMDGQTHFGRWTLGFTGRWFSYMEAVDKILVIFIPGVQDYRQANEGKGEWIVDGRLGYELSGHTRISLIANNLLNNEYSLRPGLAEAPRNFVLRLEVKL